jgi:hypothetical protein
MYPNEVTINDGDSQAIFTCCDVCLLDRYNDENQEPDAVLNDAETMMTKEVCRNLCTDTFLRKFLDISVDYKRPDVPSKNTAIIKPPFKLPKKRKDSSFSDHDSKIRKALGARLCNHANEVFRSLEINHADKICISMVLSDLQYENILNAGNACISRRYFKKLMNYGRRFRFPHTESFHGVIKDFYIRLVNGNDIFEIEKLLSSLPKERIFDSSHVTILENSREMQTNLQSYLEVLNESKKRKSDSTEADSSSTPRNQKLKKYTVDELKSSYNNWLTNNVPLENHTLFHKKRLQIHIKSNLIRGDFLEALQRLQYTQEVEGLVIPGAVPIKFWGVGNNNLNLS